MQSFSVLKAGGTYNNHLGFEGLMVNIILKCISQKFIKVHFLDKAKLCIYFAVSTAVHKMAKRLKITGAEISLEECTQT
jgi:hypothetical protein